MATNPKKYLVRQGGVTRQESSVKQSAGSADRKAIRDALAKIPNFEGVTGTMQFKEGSGDPIKSAVILQVKGDQFVWFANAAP